MKKYLSASLMCADLMNLRESVDELEKAMQVFCTCLKMAALEKLLNEKTGGVKNVDTESAVLS